MATDESEEAKGSKGISCGTKPSQREIDEHERTHMPFRSWCEHCVKGRAQSTPHYHRDHSEDQVPTISWDYWFIDEEQDKNKGNEEDGKSGEEMRCRGRRAAPPLSKSLRPR